MQRKKFFFSTFIEILVNGGWDDVCSMIRFPRMQQADFLRLVTREEDSLPFDKKISFGEKTYSVFFMPHQFLIRQAFKAFLMC